MMVNPARRPIRQIAHPIFPDSAYVMVYHWCMSRTNIDIDEKACAAVMRRYQFSTKREAVNFALQTLATEPFNHDEARKLRGSGWDGDLDEMRTSRST
jgi:Arc/MetJ family transcription regulator